MGTFGGPKPNALGQAVQYGGQQQQRIQGALTGSIPSRDSGFGSTQPVNVNVADIVGATAQHLAGPTPTPVPGMNVPTRPMQQVQFGSGVPPPDAIDYQRQAEFLTNPMRQQVQYAGGTQQAIDSAMNTSGVTIQELIRRIANRPKF